MNDREGRRKEELERIRRGRRGVERCRQTRLVVEKS
jgi:hypothetical protein